MTFLAAVAVACGGGGSKSSSSSAPSGKGPDVAATQPAASAPASAGTSAPASSAASGVQKVALKAGEDGEKYFFSQSQVNVKAGQVEVDLTNDGPNRPHNFVVKKLDGSDLASMDRLNPGQSNSVTFTLSAPGTYQFICSLPGHADRGAKGMFVVS